MWGWKGEAGCLHDDFKLENFETYCNVTHGVDLTVDLEVFSQWLVGKVLVSS